MCAVVWCLASLSALGAELESSPTTEANSRVSCAAYANLSVRLTDVGRCTGVASAECSSIAEAENVFRDAYENWWAEEGICDQEKVVAAAETVATAMARVYSESIAKVSCTGSGGFACGWAIGSGEAYGVSFVTSLAQASADAGGDNAEAFCTTDVVAKGGAIAEAASESQASACVDGVGSDVDFESAFISTVTDIVAEAFASAIADVCSDGVTNSAARARCEARSEVDADSEQTSRTVGGGRVSGSTDTIPDCGTAIKDRCCASEYRSRRCVCRGCNGPLTRIATFEDGGLRTWRDMDNVLCKCV